jgi:nonsense-mediated mRNA decay protein 3
MGVWLQEIEEDEELRARVNIYRDPRVQLPAAGSAREPTMDADDDDDGDVPEVPLEELLNALTIDQARDPVHEEHEDDESDDAMED